MKKILFIFLILLSNIGFAQSKSKEDVLKSLAGNTYQLDAIYASMGANTMVDYYKSKGIWKGTMSMLMMGRREAENLKITPVELKKLNTMKIVINTDLSVVLSCNDVELANIPFKSDGMVFELKGTYEEFSANELDKIKPDLIYKEGELYLYAIDSLEESYLEPYDLAGVAPTIMVITYNLKENNFKILLSNSEVIGAASYEFKKRAIVKKKA